MGYFILGNLEGRWWDGQQWCDDPAAAERYEDELDPDRQAGEAAVRVQERTGAVCNVYFVLRDGST